ncbi:MAG: ATP phosphoribosyltransferase [Lautropia sp.]
MLTLALSKGRILDDAAGLLARCGIAVDAALADSRKLILPTGDPGLRLLIVRASDVPTYVEHGGADLGIAGRDVMLEHGGEGVYQPVDLGIGRCRMCVAAPQGFDYGRAVRRGQRLRVATKYVRVANEHFARKGVHVDLIKLYGSMELAPLVGLADAIVDLVSTGSTLAANNLVAVEEIMPISARLIVNQASMKMQQARLAPLIAALERAAQGGPPAVQPSASEPPATQPSAAQSSAAQSSAAGAP